MGRKKSAGKRDELWNSTESPDIAGTWDLIALSSVYWAISINLLIAGALYYAHSEENYSKFASTGFN